MSVIRVNKTKDFTVMSNYHLRDKRLSFKAKGLLSQMLALPEDWDYTVAGLVSISKEAKAAVRSTLKELEEAGYLVRTRVQGEKGHFDYLYDIYEQPCTSPPCTDSPCTENRYTDSQYTENQPQLNTNNKLLNNKVLNNKINKQNESVFKEEFEEIWKEYPRKQGKTPALKAYIKARKEGIQKDVILNGVKEYSKYVTAIKVDQRYIKQGSTWFSQRCWEDQFTVVVEDGKTDNVTDENWWANM